MVAAELFLVVFHFLLPWPLQWYTHQQRSSSRVVGRRSVGLEMGWVATRQYASTPVTHCCCSDINSFVRCDSETPRQFSYRSLF